MRWPAGVPIVYEVGEGRPLVVVEIREQDLLVVGRVEGWTRTYWRSWMRWLRPLNADGRIALAIARGE